MFKKVSGKEIPYTIVRRRKDDIPSSYADITYAKVLLIGLQKSALKKCVVMHGFGINKT